MATTVDLPNRTLHPGELYLARSPTLLQTILGSCVAVTFWSARLGAGAMCHGVLPRWRESYGGRAGVDDHRYVDLSIQFLANQFDALGAARQEVEVKLFGGADVLPVMASRAHILTVGALNCRAALEVLQQEGFCVAASDLRGVRGRRIHFHTGTGEVMVHRLASWVRLEAQPDDEGSRSASSRPRLVSGTYE
jgi:chemotaxis protein CheD